MGLLERADQIAVVAERFDQLDGGGHLVLISGEAGVGKSALVHELLDHHLADGRVLLGRCDELFAPRPLGPFADIARAHPGPLGAALGGGDQAQVFDALLAELAAPPSPTVLVLEDLQWADEATLDLVRFVARRLDALPTLVLATHRDDIAHDHPIRRAIGTLVGPRVTRLQVPPLSVGAVRELVGDRLLDATRLHAATGGNPFFLIETLDAEPGTLPVTIRDVVLARAAPLSGPARDALDAAAVLGRHAQAALVQTVADCDTGALDECLRAGLLVDDGGRQAFRHDLVRDAVEETMTPLRRRQLHSRALAALGDDGDVVQRAHHAIGAGDEPAIVSLATKAADQCVDLGAWRQAAMLYGQALEHAGDDLPQPDLRRLLEATTTTSLRVELVEEALAAVTRLVELLEAAGEVEQLSIWESQYLSYALRAVGLGEQAALVSKRAVERVAHLPESEAYARALSSYTGTLLVSGRYTECVEASQSAVAAADRLGLEEAAVYALNSWGAALGSLGDPTGTEPLGESIDRAKRGGHWSAVARGAANLGFTLISVHRPAAAISVYDDGIAACEEQELTLQLNCLLPGRAEAYALLGDWDRAAADYTSVLVDPHASVMNRVIVLFGLGRLRSRRGDPGGVEALEEALQHLGDSDEAQLIAPIHIALAEAAWFKGDQATLARHVEATIPFGPLLDHCMTRELVIFSRRAGIDWTPLLEPDQATALALAGDHRGLAALWESAGILYEAADALVDSDDVDDVRRGHEVLTRLGANPRAQMAARKLRDLGARDVPRGPRATTRANAAGLTARELEVASLLAEGLTNAEIAERLIVSAKTVDHHTSAVLTKLGVSSRRHVAQAASKLGLDLSPSVAGA
ncbi:MAG: ATP-binding protein [Acidimicrobiales bacterium]